MTWAFFKRFKVKDPESGDVYLDRLRIIETPLLGIYLHKIESPDFGRDLHDHPWPFVSVVLRGGYIEEIPSGPRRIRWFNMKRSTDRHRIKTLLGDRVVTLVVRGRRRRKWGFHTESGWVPFDEYEKLGHV